MRGKNQHFVPRFYLKRFSVLESTKLINTYLVSNRQFYKGVPIKNQASKSNYYGDADELNTPHERRILALLSKIDKSKNTYSKKGLFKLTDLVIHFNLRNPVRIESFKKSAEDVGNDLKEELINNFDTFSFHADKKLVQKSIEGIIDTRILSEKKEMPRKLLSGISNVSSLIAEGLKCKIIENKTNFPFICSDNPTIIYNQLFAGLGLQNVNGLGNKGVQLFLPISPKLLIILFDKTIYKIGTEEINRFFVKNENDIHQLNKLQIYNCKSNIYGNDGFSNDYAQYLSSMVTVDQSNTYHTNDNVKLSLTFVQFTYKALQYLKSGILNNPLRRDQPYKIL